MTRMKRSFNVGDKFRLTPNALEHYGDLYSGVYTVRQWFDHYCVIQDCSRDKHGHPGFDASAESALYEADGMNFALYEWEMQHAL